MAGFLILNKVVMRFTVAKCWNYSYYQMVKQMLTDVEQLRIPIKFFSRCAWIDTKNKPIPLKPIHLERKRNFILSGR